MRKSCIGLIIAAWIIGHQAQAELGVINIHITANLVANTCSVSLASQNQTVNMGEWADKQFANNKTTLPKPFWITFENCDAGAQGVKIVFNGRTDPADPALLALSGPGEAKNVALAILDKNRIPLAPGKSSSVNVLRPVAEGQPVQFYAQYVATGAPVVAGEANAEATFTVEYL
ncbi:type 1 fimbrial protein [Shimwellia pseudoproteus]|uniref:fimbrial protein n=1 Tax=Shimwellia pseudoproteus TaxID=570012 RepID=UPI0018EB4DEA|nr:fimbrial protein [Shimwellia pseudoproteus]MBJ3816581.1 type 1 fimbrial protein [Shimwellia pseudoproteus]